MIYELAMDSCPPTRCLQCFPQRFFDGFCWLWTESCCHCTTALPACQALVVLMSAFLSLGFAPLCSSAFFSCFVVTKASIAFDNSEVRDFFRRAVPRLDVPDHSQENPAGFCPAPPYVRWQSPVNRCTQQRFERTVPDWTWLVVERGMSFR